MNLSRKLIASVLLLVNFALLHYVISSIPLRFDMTADNIYTLSDSTKKLLNKLEDPVQLDFYYTKSIDDLPVQFAAFGTRVEQMLKQYERAGGTMVKLRVIDPKPDTLEEEMAISAGLQGTEWRNGDKIYLGLVATQGDVEKNIPFFNWNKEDFLEYDLSRLIYDTQQFTKSRLGLITALPLQAPPYGGMPGQPPPQDQYIVEQLETTFDIEPIEATATELPADLDMLAIIHPQGLSEDLVYAIDQFALSGKPIFLAVDPISIISAQQSRQMGMMMGGGQDNSSNLPELLNAWGLEFDSAEGALDRNFAYTQGSSIHPVYMVFDTENTNQEIMPAAGLDGIFMIGAGGLKRKEDATTSWEPLFTLTDEAATVSSMMMQFSDGMPLLKQATPATQTLYIGGFVTGEAKTAFPDGKPTEPEAESAVAAPAGLQSGNITAFVIADTDWLMDDFTVQRINFLGTRAVQLQNDNQKLAANLMDFLGGSKDLIGIRAKRRAKAEFEVVKTMEAEAQKVYQAKLQEVEDKLQEVNSKLQKLVGDQRGSGQIVMTPEMEKTAAEYKDQEAKFKAERREIRHNLRQGIDRLGNMAAAVNVLWAPIGLIAFYVVFNRMRNQK